MLKVLYSCVYLDELDCTRLVALVGLVASARAGAALGGP
jgi:hypothetical protein